MKTVIKCQQDVAAGIAGFVARKLDYLVPKVNFIIVWDGFSEEEVIRSVFDIENHELHLTISADYGGEYAARLKEESGKIGNSTNE